MWSCGSLLGALLVTLEDTADEFGAVVGNGARFDAGLCAFGGFSHGFVERGAGCGGFARGLIVADDFGDGALAAFASGGAGVDGDGLGGRGRLAQCATGDGGGTGLRAG